MKLDFAAVATIIAGIMALIGVFFATYAAKINELDSKSGWRKKLFELSSKDCMTLDDVYLLRSAVRLDKHKLPYDLYSFKYMSNEITIFCEYLSKKYRSNETRSQRDGIDPHVITDYKDKEIVRIYSRYLLKNQWEVFSSKIFFFSNEFKLRKEHEIGREIYDLIKNIDN